MRGEIDAPPSYPWQAEPIVVASINRRHREKNETQAELRDTIALWAGWQRHQARDDSQIYRLFFLAFGTDILSAQTLGAKDAFALHERIAEQLQKAGVVAK